jgi:hypothetical protein
MRFEQAREAAGSRTWTYGIPPEGGAADAPPVLSEVKGRYTLTSRTFTADVEDTHNSAECVVGNVSHSHGKIFKKI